MKLNEITKGQKYVAKVNDKLTTVRVDDIRKVSGATRFDVTNLRTGRKTTFASAQKFIRVATGEEQVKDAGARLTDLVKDGTVDSAIKSLRHLGGQYASPKTDEGAVAVLEEKPSGLAAKLSAKTEDDAAHLVIEARAGTGKTTTLVEGLKRVKGIASNLQPSAQQKLVWDAMEESRGVANTICFVAFNKSIASELQQRVPQGCDAMTMHSLGVKAVNKAFNRPKLNEYRVDDIIQELTGRDIRELRRYKPEFLAGTKALVGLCKQNLVDGSEEELDGLARHYDIELNGSRSEIFALVPKVLDLCKQVDRDGCIDFDDMIWLPVALNLSLYRYDLLLVDEAQDLNRCQQQLALKAGNRIILCGDPKQAIYGFAGADSKSMSNMTEILGETERGVKTLPLTVTRRCGHAIVKEAQKLVPDFEAFETNCEGTISRAAYNEQSKPGPKGEATPSGLLYHQYVHDGDMVLCRVNAPLVSQCFRFLKQGRKANIQGRDIGRGLIKTVEKLSKDSQAIVDFTAKLSDWLHGEVSKENAKRNPSEQRIIALQDRHDCLACFAEDATTVDDIKRKIESIFTDDKKSAGIRLSSIHKAKGLEANRVFLLQPKGAECPHPMAKTAWAKEQENNLLYVAITRAIEELVYVS